MRALTLTVVLACFLSTFHARSLPAQKVSMPPLKAAFLFNFVKFTEWPVDAAPRGTQLVLCVLGDDQVSSFLAQATTKHRGPRPTADGP